MSVSHALGFDVVSYVDPAELDPFADTLGDHERATLDLINTKVAAAESLEAVMNFVFDATKDIIPCDRIGLAFLEENGRRSVARWGRTLYEPMLLRPGYAEDTAGSSLMPILQTGRLRIIHDLKAYLEINPESRSTRLLVQEGVRSSMTCPLRVENRIVGWLFRSSQSPRAYSRREAFLHREMAERLSQAVERAWRMDQLAAANAAYLDMLGTVSHELKSPLASIVMDADVIAGGYLGPVSEAQRTKILRLKQKAEALVNMVKKYLELVRIEEGRMEPRFEAGIQVAEGLIEPALAMLEAQWRDRNMRIRRDWPAGLTVEGDPDLLQLVFMNLVGNGIKYGRANGELRITASNEGGRFRAAVRNEGIGFKPEERGRLFRKFSRLPSSASTARGTGVGLYTCWQILQQHGGRLEADAEYGQWAEFRLDLPQPPHRPD